jgi:hypothetical protein
MRENEAEVQPALADGEQEPTGSWSTNGSEPASDGDGVDAAAAAAAADEPKTDATDDDSAAFLADLARVMQTAAGAERLRIAEDSERRRKAHLDLIKARETSEAEELQVLAEGDVKAIDTWADTEIERIQSERERRITSRRGELAQRLEDHRLLIGREVDAVEAAIAAYRTEVEVYFSRLDAETDPVAIAREAGRRPQFPVLGSDGSDASAGGIATAPTGEGVADDQEPPPADGESAASDGEVPPVASVGPDSGAEPRDEQGGPSETKAEAVDATGVPNAVAPRSSAALMGSWFRRGDDGAGRPDADS